MTTPNQHIPNYWSDIFPYEPYDNQIEGINQTINTLDSGGIHLLEGPCGTGKTLIALTAGLSLIRDPSTKFSRILVITSKKQQLSAFEADLSTINNRSEDYFKGLSLVGKSDLCPYVQSGKIGRDEIYHKCIGLRDSTHQLMSEAVEQNQAGREADAAFGLELRAEQNGENNTPLTVENIDTPYQSTIPDVAGNEYCPFYASHITNTVQDTHPLDLHEVTTAQETLKKGARKGTCPHLEMRRLHDDSSVLFGNYKHVFDPATVGGLTGGVIDETTLLIADEAHGLVQEVQDQLSYYVSYPTLQRGTSDIADVQSWVMGEGNQKKCKLASSILSETEVGPPDLAIAIKFIEKIQKLIATQITNTLKEKYGERWQDACRKQYDESISIPLQDPASQEPDSITVWSTEKGYDNIWEKTLKVTKAVSAIKDVVSREVEGKSPDGSFPIGNIHELLERWWVGDHTEYYREVELEARPNPRSDAPQSAPWKTGHRATVKIHNCIPQNEIAGTLNVFGGALLMSATLSPLEIYKEVTGIDKLEKGAQPSNSLVTMALPDSDSEDEEDGQGDNSEVGVDIDLGELDTVDAMGNKSSPDNTKWSVGESEFELGFPKENRLSLAVDAPRFSWSNRWPPEDHPRLRETYRSAISAVAKTTPGNVLIAMPSYQEAAWAGDVLANDPYVEKNILTDTSSTDTATEQIKQAFFDGPPKVLTTSLRGTLIEGVDFAGDKLHGVAVCGVPITNTSSNLASAVEAAYDHRFKNKGFEYAFSIPAVRKTRQALGRVIRGSADVGVRVLIDERYVQSGRSGMKQYFPEYESQEFAPIGSAELLYELETFWRDTQP